MHIKRNQLSSFFVLLIKVQQKVLKLVKIINIRKNTLVYESEKINR